MKNVVLIAICLPAVDQSEAIFMCTLVQALLAYRMANVRFPSQILHSRLPSPTSRHDLGRLRIPAPAVQKIDPWHPLLNHLLVYVC
jgi:hypothetical protein